MSGEANFVMEQTNLTVGGFTQPSNIEKGLSTRFLWIFPKPCYAKFESLEPIDQEFSTALGTVGFVYTTYILKITFVFPSSKRCVPLVLRQHINTLFLNPVQLSARNMMLFRINCTLFLGWMNCYQVSRSRPLLQE